MALAVAPLGHAGEQHRTRGEKNYVNTVHPVTLKLYININLRLELGRGNSKFQQGNSLWCV